MYKIGARKEEKIWSLSSVFSKSMSWIADLPLPVQIILVLGIILYAFYSRSLRHREKRWKHIHEERMEQNQQNADVKKSVIQGLVEMERSRDSVKKIRSLSTRSTIEPFSNMSARKKEIIEKYENMVMDQIEEEINEMESKSPKGNAPVRRSKRERMKSSENRKGVSQK